VKFVYILAVANGYPVSRRFLLKFSTPENHFLQAICDYAQKNETVFVKKYEKSQKRIRNRGNSYGFIVHFLQMP